MLRRSIVRFNDSLKLSYVSTLPLVILRDNRTKQGTRIFREVFKISIEEAGATDRSRGHGNWNILVYDKFLKQLSDGIISNYFYKCDWTEDSLQRRPRTIDELNFYRAFSIRVVIANSQGQLAD